MEGFLIPPTRVTCHANLVSFDVLMLLLMKFLIKYNKNFFSGFHNVIRPKFFRHDFFAGSFNI